MIIFIFLSKRKFCHQKEIHYRLHGLSVSFQAEQKLKLFIQYGRIKPPSDPALYWLSRTKSTMEINSIRVKEIAFYVKPSAAPRAILSAGIETFAFGQIEIDSAVGELWAMRDEAEEFIKIVKWNKNEIWS